MAVWSHGNLYRVSSEFSPAIVFPDLRSGLVLRSYTCTLYLYPACTPYLDFITAIGRTVDFFF